MATTALITPPRAPNPPEPWSDARRDAGPAVSAEPTFCEVVDEPGPAARRGRIARRATIEVSDADAGSFHAVRPRLFGIAYRVLGSASQADDVVQDAWIRWQGTDRSRVRDATAFLAATTMRLAINVGQSARARREISIEPGQVESVDTRADRLSGQHRRPVRAAEKQRLLDAFVAAARTGDIATLEHLLAADVAGGSLLRVAA